MEGFNIEINDQSGNSKDSISTILSNVFSINMLLPLLLFGFINRGGESKVKTEQIIRSAEMLKNVMPYFGSKEKEAISKMESILDIMYAINRYDKGEYKKDVHYKNTYDDVENKPIKILETLSPHMRGGGKKTVDRVLVVNDRINKLKDRSNRDGKALEDFEHMTDILEIIKSDKGREVREVLNKVKALMEILRT